MSFLLYVKKNLTNLPYFIGSPLSHIPYNYRPGMGKVYRRRLNEIEQINQADNEFIKNFIFEKVKSVAIHANYNIPFYSKLYKSTGVNPSKFRCFNDLTNLPIITKSDLQQVDLVERTFFKDRSYIVNTGGSSGKPLDFYIEPTSIPHEWAHMHTIWGKLGFNQSNLRLVFAGRADVDDVILYDSARHQFNVDLYAGWFTIAEKLLHLYIKCKPQYLHGYPSAIFDFVTWLRDHEHPLLPVLKDNIKGIFLGSEFPSPQARSRTEKLLGCKSISWYGHTERSILAYESIKQYSYRPFHSYGFAEGVFNEGLCNLVSTNYYNYSSPLIRYNTEDNIEPNINNGVLTSFEISQGRDGEYVIDLRGNKVFLTALIFGRHHKLFDVSNHIQVDL